MRVKYWIVVLFALFFAACNGGKKEPGQQMAETDDVSGYDTVLSVNFYKRMEGTIAGKQVVVHLHSFNGEVTGMYYYIEHGLWIMLDGKINTANPNSLSLTESNFSNGEKIAGLDCVYEQGTLKGSWRNANGDKNYLIDLKESYPPGSYTFTTMQLDDSLAAFQSDTAPVARVSKAFLLPLKDDESSRWLSSEMKIAFGIDTALRPFDMATAVAKMNGRFLKGYRDEVKSLVSDDMMSMLNYVDDARMTICYNENGYLILDNTVFSYTGGAHGNGGSSFTCFDVQNKKKLNWRDLLSADSAQLQPVVEAAFRRQQALGPNDSLNTILFDNHLATTENFYFTSKGIAFYYFPYEVAAYALGPIQVFVSFEALHPYLRPEFAQRMKLQ